jgi:hypothetical protein
VGTISALDEVDSFERTTVPGAVTVPVTDPGTMVVYYENPAELARYATDTPTWQQLRLTVTGPDGAVVPVSTYRSTARYDVDPGRFGRAVAKFEAATAGQYRVSTARAVEPGATLAVGDKLRQGHRPHRPGRRLAGAGDVAGALTIAVVTYRARSRPIR